MGKLNLIQGSIASFVLRGFAAFVNCLSDRAALFLGRLVGDIAFQVSARQRRLVLSQIKTAFGHDLPYRELVRIMRAFYQGYGQSLIELARLPGIARRGFHTVVDIKGRDQVDEIMAKGQGCIFLSIHSGNWELSNLVGSMLGHPYNMVANDLEHINKVAEFINELRRSAGCHIINPGIGGREIIRRLKANEIVTLVADQGGADGFMVPFFGRDASMSTGAVRIALKYDVPVMLVDIHRKTDGRHSLVAEPFPLTRTGDTAHDLSDTLKRMMQQYQAWTLDHPAEYVWSYKTWKYAKDRLVLILDDGRVGHLRQSQTAAKLYVHAATEKGFKVRIETVLIRFKNDTAAALLPFLTGGRFLYAGSDIGALAHFLEPESFAALMAVNPDLVISCGSRNAAVAWWAARDARARSVALLPNRNLPSGIFDLSIMHQHDAGAREAGPRTVVTRGALNLIDKIYLDENGRALLARFQHLRGKVRSKLALLIGGDAQGVVMEEQSVKVVVHQMLSAADDLGCDLLVTTSRRTPAAVEQMLLRELKDHPRCALMIIASRSNVPEAVGGILALADIVVVSGESVSMVSEAASSGKKVVAFSPDAGGVDAGHKYARFCDMFARQGHILYTDPKGVAAAIDRFVRNKNITQPVRDRERVLNAMRSLVR